ncbi:multiheme c-type cytochrome [Candidatus Poribacteria bacterium]
MMKNLYIGMLFICCVCFYLPFVVNVSSAVAEDLPPVSEETEMCIECHLDYTPGIVEDWRKSRHAAATPEEAAKKPEAERRVSAQTFPDSLRSVSVGCYECHGLNVDAHEDSFEHVGMEINLVVSPNDCKTCHPVEAEQYTDSKKAHALGNLGKNPVYHQLVETITGVKEVKDGKTVLHQASDNAKGETCYACHGTEVKVEGMRAVSTDVGDLELPILSGWPNQGVGRINPDGSRGACTSCHPRHSFSIEIARKPYTCAQCHLEPDVPAWNVYKESKHGNIFLSKHHKWHWDEVPWKVGKDFDAPTCSACHNSLIAMPDGETIAPRTHNFGDRLWVRIFGLIYSHPQPQKGDTHIIKNKDDLPLPVTFGGDPASEYLIDQAEQAKRQAVMEDLCNSCHGSSWTNAHFARMDNTIEEVDKMVLAAAQLMKKAWKDGLADNSNPFDETLEHKWLQQWLFYANSVRYASAMTGAPDYAAFKNGWWELTRNLAEMQSLIALQADKPSKSEADASVGAPERAESADSGYGSVGLSELSSEGKKYLGLADDAKLILRNVDADLIIVEFLNVYCPSCQTQASVLNRLYSDVQKDSALQSKVKMMGIGVGNDKKETGNFEEEREIAFPVLPDPKFEVYEGLAVSRRTPYTVMLKKNKDGNLVLVSSHAGLIKSYESYLDEVKTVMGYSEDTLRLKQAQSQIHEVVEKTELRLSGTAELMPKVRESMIRASRDDDIAVTPVSIPIRITEMPENPEAYEGKSRNARYFSIAVNRESVCDLCDPIQFIYTFNEEGDILDFEPIHLTKYGNKEWNEKDIEEMRRRIVGRSVLHPVNFDFDSEVDAVTSATMTSAAVFQALAKSREIFRFVIK